jgi:hypothetical protein
MTTEQLRYGYKLDRFEYAYIRKLEDGEFECG